MTDMQDKREEAPRWEAMEIEDAGHVGEVLQGSKISTIERGEVVADQFEN